jgi:hypothetical protein
MLVEDRNYTEGGKSEDINNREHKNKMPEDRKSVATRAIIICDSLPRKNTDFRTRSCEIPSKP